MPLHLAPEGFGAGAMLCFDSLSLLPPKGRLSPPHLPTVAALEGHRHAAPGSNLIGDHSHSPPRPGERRLLSTVLETTGLTVESMMRSCQDRSFLLSQRLTPSSASEAGSHRPSSRVARRCKNTEGRACSAGPSQPPAAPEPVTRPSWIKGRPLGGTVYTAFDPVTMQTFPVKELAVGCGEGEKRREQMSVELDICVSPRHPSIVTFWGFAAVEYQMYVFFELVAGSSMASVLRACGALDRSALRKATRGMFWSTVGSVQWMAPEASEQADGQGRKSGASGACTVIEMAMAEKAWGEGASDNLVCAMYHIANSSAARPLRRQASQECADLIVRCTRRAQGERPSTRELRLHGFLV